MVLEENKSYYNQFIPSWVFILSIFFSFVLSKCFQGFNACKCILIERMEDNFKIWAKNEYVLTEYGPFLGQWLQAIWYSVVKVPRPL